jgi:hypothetical protein
MGLAETTVTFAFTRGSTMKVFFVTSETVSTNKLMSMSLKFSVTKGFAVGSCVAGVEGAVGVVDFGAATVDKGKHKQSKDK